MRRRRGRLQHSVLASCSAGMGPEGGRADKARRLETHVWHAKRMHMVTRQCLSASPCHLRLHRKFNRIELAELAKQG